MVFPHLFTQAPTPKAHRGFRIGILLLALVVLVLVKLQYGAHALFPVSRTSTLWGFFVGIVLMGLFVDRRWTAAARREPPQISEADRPQSF